MVFTYLIKPKRCCGIWFFVKFYSNVGFISEYVTEEGREEDAESGNGPSLPQSPHSVEGAICGPKSLDSDFGK